MSHLRLRHDVLDAQLTDRNKEKIGRVDALLLELRDDRPPRVATIVIGGDARAQRIGHWMVALRSAIGAMTGRRRERTSHVPFTAMRSIADSIELDVEGETLESGHLERWLRDHVVCRIPGASGERK